jgi:hypothetical protein
MLFDAGLVLGDAYAELAGEFFSFSSFEFELMRSLQRCKRSTWSD